MPKGKRTRLYVTHGIKRTGGAALPGSIVAEGRWGAAGQPQNIPRGTVLSDGWQVNYAPVPTRPIPVLNRIGRRVAYCYAPLRYMYAQ